MKCVSGTQNQYLYTSFIQQLALDTSHKYHEILMLLVSFPGSVHNGTIRVDIDTEPPGVIPYKVQSVVMGYEHV